jgi:hypothetical protein
MLRRGARCLERLESLISDKLVRVIRWHYLVVLQLGWRSGEESALKGHFWVAWMTSRGCRHLFQISHFPWLVSQSLLLPHVHRLIILSDEILTRYHHHLSKFPPSLILPLQPIPLQTVSTHQDKANTRTINQGHTLLGPHWRSGLIPSDLCYLVLLSLQMKLLNLTALCIGLLTVIGVQAIERIDRGDPCDGLSGEEYHDCMCQYAYEWVSGNKATKDYILMRDHSNCSPEECDWSK